MLTDQENEWLERRKNICERCSNRKWCRVGKKHGYNTTSCRFHKHSFKEDYYDAARFEAQVANWLCMKDVYDSLPCSYTSDASCPLLPCPPFEGDGYCGYWCMMRMARIAVEEEMGAKKHGR